MKQVTAAVIIEDGRLFITRRPPGDPLAGLWELPGGKIEPGETPQQCLARELAEELNMTAEIGEIVAQTTYHCDHGSFEMLAPHSVYPSALSAADSRRGETLRRPHTSAALGLDGSARYQNVPCRL